MGRILLKDIVLKGEETDILINGSRISRIGRIADMEMPSSDMEVVDCKGKTAFPGFVNMHTHAGMAMMRGIGEDISFHAPCGTH